MRKTSFPDCPQDEPFTTQSLQTLGQPFVNMDREVSRYTGKGSNIGASMESAGCRSYAPGVWMTFADLPVIEEHGSRPCGNWGPDTGVLGGDIESWAEAAVST